MDSDEPKLRLKLKVANFRIDNLAKRIDNLMDEKVRLRTALEELVQLQAHYATLLNQYDGGKRTAFKSVDEFLQRLDSLKEKLDGIS